MSQKTVASTTDYNNKTVNPHRCLEKTRQMTKIDKTHNSILKKAENSEKDIE